VEAERLMEERVAFSPFTSVTLYRSMTGVEDGSQDVEVERLMEEKVALSPSTCVTLCRSMTGEEVGNQRWRRRGLGRRE
jgi:hypothetical protein